MLNDPQPRTRRANAPGSLICGCALPSQVLRHSTTLPAVPASGWKWISNTPDPTSKEFDGDPATELKIESLFETLARMPDGTAEDSETITATISMPKIDLSITNPDNEEIGKDKFDTGGGIIVLLPASSGIIMGKD